MMGICVYIYIVYIYIYNIYIYTIYIYIYIILYIYTHTECIYVYIYYHRKLWDMEISWLVDDQLWGFNHMGDVDNMEDIVYNQFDMKIWV